jgi:hypothetical protein
VKRDIYEAITERFIEQLKRGTVPWQKPWFAVQNIVSRKPYRGINALLLGSTDYQSPFWISFKQALDLGGHVKKRNPHGTRSKGRPGGAREVVALSHTVCPWASFPDQTDPAPEHRLWQNVMSKSAAFRTPARPTIGGFAVLLVIRGSAPSDTTFTPEITHPLHEMTIASSRLDREGITQHAKFGSDRYSKEELVAELGAAFLSNEAQILDGVRFENSAAYLASWVSKFENDPRMIVSAASQAQKASDFIMGIEHKESLQECQTSPEGMPLTWAREHGIDTRIPGFAHHDQDGDGVSTPWNGSTAFRAISFQAMPVPWSLGKPKRYPAHIGASWFDRALAPFASDPCRGPLRNGCK